MNVTAGALSSILSWLGSCSSSLLPRVACPEAPWLALFVLEVEQNENEANTGLWRQLLTELANPSRPTLDQAMKVNKDFIYNIVSIIH
jgi:hypothetical protein